MVSPQNIVRILTVWLMINNVVAQGAETGNPSSTLIIPEPTRFVTEHRARFNGTIVNYTVTAGETYIRDADGKARASIFSFAYEKSDRRENEVRPVTFLWGGGPGSTSVNLHMGTFGPQRVSVPSDAKYPGPPPYTTVPTPETILDVTDLVFVDTVGTGFSRAIGDTEDKEFWGLYEDAQSVANFIHTWITENSRWNSPRFILGISYGTTRAGAVAKILENDMQVSLNGIILLSQALDFQGSSPYVRDNLISYITYVPTMAATAWYHGKIHPHPEDFETFISDSRRFATDELLPALFKGNAVEAAQKDRIRDRLSYFTGLSPEYVERANLRIQGTRFAKELLREEGLALSRLDSRYTTDELDDLAAEAAGDAASHALGAAFKATLLAYISNDLNVDWKRPYVHPGARGLTAHWRYRTVPDGQRYEPKYVNTAHDLATALRSNPALKVLVASGYYDLATPFFDAEFTLDRHDIRREQVKHTYYPGGHSMYVNEPSRTQLLEATRNFILSLGGS